MLTVRSRAIELAADPSNFRPDAPLSSFELPSEAKLEADAHLAVCIDDITTRLADSEDHQAAFLEDFSQRVRAVKGVRRWWAMKNSQLDEEHVAQLFETSFVTAYNDKLIIAEALQTPFGEKTSRACEQYAEAASQHIGLHLTGTSAMGEHLQANLYNFPDTLIGSGLRTFAGSLPETIVKMRRSGLPPEILEQRLPAGARSLRAVASLSIAQLQASRVTSGLAVNAESNTLDPELLVARQLPKYHTEIGETLRSHIGCPAMPALPATDRLGGDSGIGKLWLPAAWLMLATGVHALGDDRRQYSIARMAYHRPLEKSPPIR